MTYDARIHNDLTRLPERLADACGRALKSTRITMDAPTTDWRIDYTSGGATNRTLSLDFEASRKRIFSAVPVAIGHAVFFLALALAGWLR